MLYNFTDKERTDKVKFIFVLMGIKIRSVSKEDYLQPIGALSGVTRMERTEEVYEGEGFEEEMLLLVNCPGPLLDRFLQGFRRNKIPPVALKAVLTPTNRAWTSLQLREELAREQAAIAQGNAAHAKGPEGEG